MLGDIRVSAEQVMDYTTPRLSIKLLLIVDLDSYGSFLWYMAVSEGFLQISPSHHLTSWGKEDNLEK